VAETGAHAVKHSKAMIRIRIAYHPPVRRGRSCDPKEDAGWQYRRKDYGGPGPTGPTGLRSASRRAMITPVPLAIGVSDVTKIFGEIFRFRSDRRQHTRAEIVEYLELVAQEARELAEAWAKIYADLASFGQSDLTTLPPKAFDRMRPLQTIAYSKLAVFYENASRVVGGRMDDAWRTSIFDCLGRLLYNRSISRAAYDAAIKNVQSRFVVDGDNASIDWTSFDAAIMALNKEAGALEALVASYKASSSA